MTGSVKIQPCGIRVVSWRWRMEVSALFEFGIVVEVFALPRPELHVPWYRFQVCSVEAGPLKAMGGMTVRTPAGLGALNSAGTIVIPDGETRMSLLHRPCSEASSEPIVRGRESCRFVPACSCWLPPGSSMGNGSRRIGDTRKAGPPLSSDPRGTGQLVHRRRTSPHVGWQRGRNRSLSSRCPMRLRRRDSQPGCATAGGLASSRWGSIAIRLNTAADRTRARACEAARVGGGQSTSTPDRGGPRTQGCDVAAQLRPSHSVGDRNDASSVAHASAPVGRTTTSRNDRRLHRRDCPGCGDADGRDAQASFSSTVSHLTHGLSASVHHQSPLAWTGCAACARNVVVRSPCRGGDFPELSRNHARQPPLATSVFFAERQTLGSNFVVQTSIANRGRCPDTP